jgi:hypothetical protein
MDLALQAGIVQILKFVPQLPYPAQPQTKP